MKGYKKPNLEITVFDVSDSITAEISDPVPVVKVSPYAPSQDFVSLYADYTTKTSLSAPNEAVLAVEW